jgi:hypothetical protein
VTLTCLHRLGGSQATACVGLTSRYDEALRQAILLSNMLVMGY